MARNVLPVFTIVGDVTLLPEYAEAREAIEREQAEQLDWRAALHRHLAGEDPSQHSWHFPQHTLIDRSHVLSDEAIENFYNEVKGIMDYASHPGSGFAFYYLDSDNE
jgi:hypothetical protein